MVRGVSWLAIAFSLVVVGPGYSGATVLGDLAASMQPGTWAELNTANLSLVTGLRSNNPTQEAGYITGFCDSALWNPVARKFVVQTAQHQANPLPIVFYDDATNTWSTGPQPFTSLTHHCYDHNAIDPMNQIVYFRKFHSDQIYRYRFSTNAWTQLPLPGSVKPNCCQDAGALVFFPEMDGGSLLYLDGDMFGVNNAGLYQFRESTGTWAVVGGQGGSLPMGPYHNFAEYSAALGVVVFGGGNGSRAVYRMDQNKVITRLADAPYSINLGLSNHVAAADPVSGHFIFLFGPSAGAGELWALNPTGGGSWTRIDANLRTAGKPCASIVDSSAGCAEGMVMAPVTTYGVLMIYKFNHANSKVYLYKHLPSTPDTTQASPPSNVLVR